MRSTKILKICSSSLWTCLHHMVILRTQNKITDFFMILAWASPFKQHVCLLAENFTGNVTFLIVIYLISLVSVQGVKDTNTYAYASANISQTRAQIILTMIK